MGIVEDKIKDLKEREKKILQMGGEKAVAKHKEKGKLTARERLNHLFDPGTFREIDMFVTHRCVNFGMEDVEIPSDGVVTGHGLVEGRQVFANLNVRQNLEMGAFLRKDKNEILKDLEYVFNVFPRLKERQNQFAGSLSGGEQQMLSMGRGLLSKPKLMLMDEPSLGLAPLLVEEIFQVIQKINSEGTTILLVEQNAKKALAVADRAYVLEVGKIIKEGKGQDLLEDPKVQEAYLGIKKNNQETVAA